MFEKYDLTKTIDEETFEKSLPPLKERLSVLQRTLRDLRIPIIVVIEGWNAAGITMSTGRLSSLLIPVGLPFMQQQKPLMKNGHARSCGGSG